MDAATWWGRAVVVVAVVAALATLLVNGDGLSLTDLASSPHLLDIDALSSDPVRSIWFLHSQVPVHNAVVGVVGWLPVPLVGTLFLLYGAAVLATGLLLHAVLVRWGTSPLVAGGLAALAMVNPALLDTIGSCGIQVPVALALVAMLYVLQRYLDRPRPVTLVLLSGVVAAGVLTWHGLAPLVAVPVLAVVARSPGRTWQRSLGCLAAALAVPAILVGGWSVKNEVVFGEPALASTIGFDLQQGVTGPMSAEGVASAVNDGAVAPLAQQQPWGSLGYYGPDRGGTGICFPAHRNPVTLDMGKEAPDDQVVPNYNNECYLPLYRQARHDAVTLATRYPARYLTTRDTALVLAYGTPEGCASEPCTWMDRLYQPLLGKVDGRVTMYDWNLPLFGTDADELDVTVSLVLAMASAAVGWRGLVAAWRLGRSGVRGPSRAEWPSGELVWVVAAASVVVVIAGTALIEVGDNSRLRAALDPMLLTFPVAALARILARGARPAPAGPTTPDPAPGSPDVPTTGDRDATAAGSDGGIGTDLSDDTDGADDLETADDPDGPLRERAPDDPGGDGEPGGSPDGDDTPTTAPAVG